MSEMTNKGLYDFSYDYFTQQVNLIITKKEIDDFLNIADVKSGWSTWQEVYGLLVVILQDFHSFANVINFKNRKTEIKKVLHNYDLHYISSLKPDNLLTLFKKEFKFERTQMWTRYCKGLISGAKFFLSFKDVEDFRNTCDSMNVNDITRESFALFLSTKIDNMGFAAACNFLKELGYQEYPKPDVHIIDICKELKLIDNKSPIEAYEAIVKVARDAGVTPYHMDKLWWLICSGNLYRYDKKTNPQKRDFIDKAKLHFGI